MNLEGRYRADNSFSAKKVKTCPIARSIAAGSCGVFSQGMSVLAFHCEEMQILRNQWSLLVVPDRLV
jgi:hypothetical protein